MTPKNSVDVLPLKKYEFNLVRIIEMSLAFSAGDICIYKFMF